VDPHQRRWEEKMNRTASIQDAMGGVGPDQPEAAPPSGAVETVVA